MLKAELLWRKLRDSFNAQDACKFLVGYYALFEIVMVTYRKMSSQFSASSRCLPQIFRCKLIIYYKLPHYRNFFTISKVSNRTTVQSYTRKQ